MKGSSNAMSTNASRVIKTDDDQCFDYPITDSN